MGKSLSAGFGSKLVERWSRGRRTTFLLPFFWGLLLVTAGGHQRSSFELCPTELCDLPKFQKFCADHLFWKGQFRIFNRLTCTAQSVDQKIRKPKNDLFYENVSPVFTWLFSGLLPNVFLLLPHVFLLLPNVFPPLPKRFYVVTHTFFDCTRRFTDIRLRLQL